MRSARERPAEGSEGIASPGRSAPISLDQSIARCFRRIAREHADRIAVSTRQGELTYAELRARAQGVAAAIAQATESLDPKPPVALFLGSGMDAVVAVFGAIEAGRIFLCADPAHPGVVTRLVLEDADAALIVTDGDHAERARELADGRHSVLDLDGELPDPSIIAPTRAIAPDDPAYILYSSGSTSAPKGIVHSHRALLHDVRIGTDTLEIAAEDRLNLFSWGTGQAIGTLFRALLNGASLCLLDVKEESPAGLVEWLRTERITLGTLTPSLFRRLAPIVDEGEALPALRLVRLGGEAVLPQDVETFRSVFPGVTLINGLASSEALNVAVGRLDTQWEPEGQRVPVGYPVDDKEVLLVDEAGREVAAGEVGEIQVRSRYLATGYWQKPDLTKERFRASEVEGVRLFSTADLGRWRDDGRLEFVGRKDSMVKIRGFRVELPEVERALLAADEVAEAAAVSVEGADGGRRLVAFVAPAEGDSLEVANLRRWLAGRLPEYMLPARFVVLPRLPRLAGGKLDRRALRPPVELPRDLEAAYVGPNFPIETHLIRIWEDALAVQPIGIRHDFFDLGGDSLTALKVFVEIERQLGVSLPLATLIKAPTIEQLIAELSESELSDPLVELRASDTGEPLFCVAGLKGHAFEFRPLVEHLTSERAVYGLQYPGVDPRDTPLTRMEAIAAEFIRWMRRVQPRGPYHLTGYSHGGIVAYEMAQQLRAANESVALLALLDTMPPIGRLEKLGRETANLAERVASRGSLGLVRYAMRTVRRRLERRRARRSAAEPLLEPSIARVRRANIEAVRRYRMLPYDGDAVLLRSRERLTRFGIDRDPQGGWGRWIEGGLQTRLLPGDHYAILKEPVVRTLAERLDELLARAPDSSADRAPGEALDETPESGVTVASGRAR